ncbi:hypothetical protein L1987_47935 [Smallanthus sonchifolius]|uniref:Uncharacterized protein n=1 Tax=Smallanthus sonchifolius TaxID=185202 RepID=A0ACB9FPW9_9ASTR|nr:hypothetical protein L1987_47935 [Smallanthus sonchifolius]
MGPSIRLQHISDFSDFRLISSLNFGPHLPDYLTKFSKFLRNFSCFRSVTTADSSFNRISAFRSCLLRQVSYRIKQVFMHCHLCFRLETTVTSNFRSDSSFNRI